jgi:hypothetical protein
VICVGDRSESPRIEIDQVIEGLAYHRAKGRVEIRLFFVVHNPTNENAGFRVVHRGDVEAELRPFTFETDDAVAETISALYAARLKPNDGDKQTAYFHSRVNCLGASPVPEVVSLTGPGGCFKGRKDSLRLNAEFGRGPMPSYTSFRIPEIAAGERSLFQMSLTISGASYDYLVKSPPWFSVDSYTRLLRDIRAYDLQRANDEAKRLFEESIAPEAFHLIPTAYDIVIFQALGDPVQVLSGSLAILPVRPDDPVLAEEVLWFFGQPASEFYLKLDFADSPAERVPKANGFVVRCETLV